MIDRSLSELVELQWRWQHEGRTPALAREVEQMAGKLEAELPSDYREFAQSIRLTVSNPAALRGLKTDTRMTASPSAGALSSAAHQLPARNSGTTSAKHVQLFTQNNGLIHGGIITIGSNKLVCRAFRYFKRKAALAASSYIEVVAGVCEQIDGNGRVVQKWTTAERLPEMYQSTSQSLPTYACRDDHNLGEGEGFYHSVQYASALTQALKDLRKKATNGKKTFTLAPIELPDDGQPDPAYYQGQFKAIGQSQLPFSRLFAILGHHFSTPPGPDTAVENALYNNRPIGTKGYVINTPYISVFSLGPSVPVVIVSMIGVYREAVLHFQGTPIMKRFERKAGWSVRSFRLR